MRQPLPRAGARSARGTAPRRPDAASAATQNYKNWKSKQSQRILNYACNVKCVTRQQ